MTNHMDRWVVAADALALVLLVSYQWYLVWDAKTTVTEKLSEAQKLVQQADATNPLPPLKDPKEHSDRVLEAWETLPSDVKPLNPWNLYPNPTPAGRGAVP